MEKRLGDQASELGRLRAALEKEKSEARTHEEALKPPPPPPPPAPPIFRLSGFAQFDYLNNRASSDQLNPTTNAPLNQDRFLIRRARLHVDIDHGYVVGALELDANTVNGLQVRPLDMEASLRWPPGPSGIPIIMATIGMFKIPFGFEIGQADTERVFLERSTMEKAFFGGEYDLGARLQGGWRFLRYSLAVMNGNPVGEATFPALDPTAFKDFVGRVGIDTPIVPGLTLQAGVSGDKGTGFHPGTPATKSTLVWHDLNGDGQVQPNELSGIPGEDATPSQDFSRFGIGGDIRLQYQIPLVGPLTVYGEVATASNLDRELFPADPLATGRNLIENGYYIGVTQDLFGWVSIGYRYDYYQPDQSATETKVGNVVPRNNALSTSAVAVAVHHSFGRVLFEYDHNTNEEGRTLTGLTTTLPNDQIAIRGEVKF